MKGLWLDEQHLQLRTNLPIPEPAAGEALVKVIQAGVCNTDVELMRGYYPYQGILGHEFVGIVVQGSADLVGQRVVGEINAVCGQCQFCLRGLSSHCQARSVLGIVNRNGAFAEYLCLPEQNLHPVPDTISNDAATFTEPLAAALEIQMQVKLQSGDRVVVVGDGKLGQLVAQTLALTGCELLVIGRHAEKLAHLEARSITTGFADAIKPQSFDYAVDCTGNAEGFAIALGALRPRGTLILKSTYAGRLSIDASAIVVNEITIIGSRCGPFPEALALLANHAVDVTPLIQARYPLAEGLHALNHAQQRGVLKVLLSMEAPTATT